MNTRFKFLGGVTDAAAFLGAVFTAAGLFGHHHHFIELFTHAKPLLALCFAGYIGLKLLLKCKRTALLAVIPLLVNATPPLMLRLPQRAQRAPERPLPVTILQANVLSSNRQADKLLALVDTLRPDVIVLQEINRRWMSTLAPLRAHYPVYAEHPREDNFGAAIFCRHTNAVASILFLSDPDSLPLSRVELFAEGKKLTIFGVHPLAPIGPYLWHWRNAYTLELARTLAETREPLIAVGDFNNTPWARHYRQFRTVSGLLDASQGRGALSTWPAGALLRLPLDHCFHSEEVIIRRRDRGPHIGSDHYPLIIEAEY
jgi:endonuclease/exonuclease/phosphatase (EEP) superfamily protein YafD